MNKIYNLISIILVSLVSVLLLIFMYQGDNVAYSAYLEPRSTYWVVQSVDTMKSSRDLSRERLNDPAFLPVIDEYARKVSLTGATHIAIGTPYDDEFLPILTAWVNSARKYGLKVWFRGNMSGWEGWFGYPSITREEHLEKTSNFITSNPLLFENGDNFSSCPECENGGDGDPRNTGDIEGFRQFLFSEHEMLKNSFNSIGKQVRYNLYSMNGDVAKLIMDKETTKKLGGLVTIDHYVETPLDLINDIKEIAELSGGRIVLGEFGVPIPDIHGTLTQSEQAEWLGMALSELINLDVLYGVNYWLGTGGSTELWTENEVLKPSFGVLEKYYKPHIFYGSTWNELFEALPGVGVRLGKHYAITDDDGSFAIRYLGDSDKTVVFSLDGYYEQSIEILRFKQKTDIALIKEEKDAYFKVKEYLKNWIPN